MLHYLTRLAFSFLLIFVLASCAKVRTQYYWGNIGDARGLYDRNKDSLTYAQSYKEVIDKQKPGKYEVAGPGLYAEYGLVLLQLGKKEQAHYYFELEKKTWPISAPVMDQFILLTH